MDIILPIAAAVLTIIMGYLGIHIAVHPVENAERARIFKALFILIGICLVACTAFQAIRNRNASQEVESLLRAENKLISGQNKDIRDIRDRPTKIIVPPNPSQESQPVAQPEARVIVAGIRSAYSSKDDDRQIWLALDEPVALNVFYVARGPADATQFRFQGKVLIAGNMSDPAIRNGITEISERLVRLKEEGSPIKAGASASWFTVPGEIIRRQDVEPLRNHEKNVYLLQTASYRDPNGKHYIHDCRRMIAIPEGTFFSQATWQLCGIFNDSK